MNLSSRVYVELIIHILGEDSKQILHILLSSSGCLLSYSLPIYVSLLPICKHIPTIYAFPVCGCIALMFLTLGYNVICFKFFARFWDGRIIIALVTLFLVTVMTAVHRYVKKISKRAKELMISGLYLSVEDYCASVLGRRVDLGGLFAARDTVHSTTLLPIHLDNRHDEILGMIQFQTAILKS